MGKAQDIPKLTLDNIQEIVKTKVPYYINQTQGRTTLHVIDKDGYRIYEMGQDRELSLLQLTPHEEITQEDIDFINEQLVRLS